MEVGGMVAYKHPETNIIRKLVALMAKAGRRK